MVFANGRIPVTDLVQAANGAPGQLLEAQTAAQWAAMCAAAERDGVHLEPKADGGVSSCYRSYDNQVYAAQVEAAGGPTAAPPGYSNHGLGIAIDIVITGQTLAWLNAHAAEFGFDNAQGQATYPPENWHWVRTRVVSVITNTITEDIMAMKDTLEVFHNGAAGRGYFVAGGGFYYPIGDKDGLGGQQKLDALASIGVPTREVDTATFDALNIVFAGNQYIYSTAQVAAEQVKK